ncbi:hypothetical protein A3766_12455 [Oleiphilus sp. HI0132]|uniref:DUF2059 domain-containing protein n=1 Tax=Oleiphilus sp. HI0132 TaxID=1822270 RepID=UPI0007C2616E|nr:DUF2059 domain-containing protein [Oleiphilus sp. HI0132]KZZ76963.1 hypothetical protein A3766_12455 [Oleiphilus sp. HI0132]
MNALVNRALAFLLLVFVSHAAPLMAKGLSIEEAKQFLHDSGLSELIASLPDSMGQQLDMKRLSVNSSVSFEKTSAAVTHAAKKVDGEQIAMVYLSQDQRAEDLSEAIKFLASPLGQRISTEERAASTPEAQQKMQRYFQEQSFKSVKQDRAQLLEKLSLALNADKVVIQLMKGVYFSVLEAVAVINPNKAAALEARMNQEWQSMEPMLSQQFSEFMLMGANYSYRNLNDEDLSAYITFLKSKPGQAYWQVGVDIVDLYIQGFVSELVSGLSSAK